MLGQLKAYIIRKQNCEIYTKKTKVVQQLLEGLTHVSIFDLEWI